MVGATGLEPVTSCVWSGPGLAA